MALRGPPEPCRTRPPRVEARDVHVADSPRRVDRLMQDLTHGRWAKYRCRRPSPGAREPWGFALQWRTYVRNFLCKLLHWLAIGVVRALRLRWLFSHTP